MARRNEVAPERTRGGVLLREWRAKTGLKQVDACRRLKIHQTMLSALETGERSPGRAIGLRLAKEAMVPLEAWDEAATEKEFERATRRVKESLEAAP